jgi:hypothetical protein
MAKVPWTEQGPPPLFPLERADDFNTFKVRRRVSGPR